MHKNIKIRFLKKPVKGISIFFSLNVYINMNYAFICHFVIQHSRNWEKKWRICMDEFAIIVFLVVYIEIRNKDISIHFKCCRGLHFCIKYHFTWSEQYATSLALISASSTFGSVFLYFWNTSVRAASIVMKVQSEAVSWSIEITQRLCYKIAHLWWVNVLSKKATCSNVLALW